MLSAARGLSNGSPKSKRTAQRYFPKERGKLGLELAPLSSRNCLIFCKFNHCPASTKKHSYEDDDDDPFTFVKNVFPIICLIRTKFCTSLSIENILRVYLLKMVPRIDFFY